MSKASITLNVFRYFFLLCGGLFFCFCFSGDSIFFQSGSNISKALLFLQLYIDQSDIVIVAVAEVLWWAPIWLIINRLYPTIFTVKVLSVVTVSIYAFFILAWLILGWLLRSIGFPLKEVSDVFIGAWIAGIFLCPIAFLFLIPRFGPEIIRGWYKYRRDAAMSRHYPYYGSSRKDGKPSHNSNRPAERPNDALAGVYHGLGASVSEANNLSQIRQLKPSGSHDGPDWPDWS